MSVEAGLNFSGAIAQARNFLSGDGVITSMHLLLCPWRMTGDKLARTTLELRAGEVRHFNMQTGERLLWEV